MKSKLDATQKNKLVCKIGKATKLTLGGSGTLIESNIRRFKRFFE